MWEWVFGFAEKKKNKRWPFFWRRTEMIRRVVLLHIWERHTTSSVFNSSLFPLHCSECHLHAFYSDPWASSSWFLLSHSCVCDYSYYSLWCVVPTLSIVLLLYIALLHSSVSRGRSCILVVFSLLIVDCFGLCSMVVTLIEGFSTLNRVSSILYNFFVFCVFLWSLLVNIQA